MRVESASNVAFAFGKNWANFLKTVDERRLEHSAAKLAQVLGDIRGSSFLDIGCGSGLHSLAALRLGASRVHSFDHDADSVECAKHLHTAFSGPANWSIEQGSALDEDYLRSLGRFDIVYAWGVLHHTGQMWRALDMITIPVADRLFISIYNDQGLASRFWRLVKRFHAHSWRPAKRIIEWGVFSFVWGKHAAANCLHLRPLATFRNWRNYSQSRGMSAWHDVVDWAGGYPFEVARPDDIVRFYESRGLRASCILDCGKGHGCNEFLIQRPDSK